MSEAADQPKYRGDVESFDFSAILSHLQTFYDRKIKKIEHSPLGDALGKKSLLSSITRLRVSFADDHSINLVLRQPRSGPFGMEELEDRARQCLLNYRSFREMPTHSSGAPMHPTAVDVGMIDKGGRVLSLADAEQFFLLEEFVEGYNYGDVDFVAMRGDRTLRARELARAGGFATFLAELHRDVVEDDSMRYRRSLRDIVGGGEGLMGVIDSFPIDFFNDHRDLLCQLERNCLAAGQRLRARRGRLRITHGDFHPWNILFRDDENFTAIDKSRCHLNDPAIDVGAMLMSYLMLAIWQRSLSDAPAMQLARRFLGTYIEASGDREILEALPLFTAMRAAAAASPLFYPEMPKTLRIQAFKLAVVIAELPAIDVELTCLADIRLA